MEKALIHSEMTVLDIVAAWESTRKVFEAYDAKAGECICCNMLFEPLHQVAQRYGIDLEALVADLNAAAAGGQ